ncbi:molybdate transport system substrate-binding protein [Ectothiorhodospira magna]|uniref:Molybdate transport system substrate-binding protein n=1 Tax=Ectothiorhodospira magna TaxID=867345 RepID=A0A1H8ZXK2_9GAMM|nr:molybdate ABC transporter substrate-binding protein [Ectothiorhodospira magna]SEP69011.1 molybdate transport system substrate-binding protein [Ectothiorhodospira magna]
MRLSRLLLTLVLLLSSLSTATAAELRAAVAANFLGTLQTLVATYEAETGHRINLSAGSSGALYAQIVNGAPFDLFFSADVQRAEALVNDGLALEDSRFTYAIGIPVLWSSKPDFLEAPETVLSSGNYRHLSITDPRTAPYGVAAQQILEHLGIWDTLNQQRRVIRAQTITQVYAQVASGAADLGFVALAQLQDGEGNMPGSHWIPPAEWFDPIAQQAVILKRARNKAVAQDFMDWLQGEQATRMIEAAGYTTP